MAKIEPIIDKYGTFARSSFFADYLEVVAFRSGRVKLSSMRDMIVDTYPSVKQILRPPGEEELTEEWSPGRLADEAWTCILERADLLGDKYPFTIQREVLTFDYELDPLESPYLSLLAITVSHAFKLMRSNFVEHLLEDVVGDSMENVGFRVGRTGPLSRENDLDFVSTMKAVSGAIDVPVNASATTRRANANDEDVDLVAHLDWNSARVGRWLFVGQVTCAVSDSWRLKAQEPAVNDWQKFFGEARPPIAFLAVPHHVDDLVFRYVAGVDVHILDRPRIVSNLNVNTQGQRDAILALMGAEFASFEV